jgi:hypothetical protein
MGWAVWVLNPGRSKIVLSKIPRLTVVLTWLLCSGYGGSFLGLKWPGYEINCSPSSNAKVKSGWSYSSVSPVCLLSVDSENFYFDVRLLKCVPF